MKKENFAFGINEESRLENAEKYLSPKTYELHNLINIILNIVFCAGILFILDFKVFQNWNLLIIVLSFIGFDVITGFVDNYLFNIRIYNKEKKLEDILELQKYVAYLEKQFQKTNKKANTYLESNCKNCHYRCWSNRTQKYYCDASYRRMCYTVKEATYWEDTYNQYNDILREKTKELETKEAVSNNKISGEYQNKLEYFKALKSKYSHAKFNTKYENLKLVVESLDKLITLLEKKPIGLTFIPNTVYIYLDELQSIFSTLEELDVEKQDRYTEMINKISSALSENIEKINKRIDEYEVGNLEVSLNVLYQELIKERENTDV